jgi:sialic acid synthase
MTVLAGELGINHNGMLANAVAIVRAFWFLDAIKVQKMHPESFLREEQKHEPHPSPENAFGGTYIQHRNNLELPAGDYRKLKNIVKEQGQQFGASVCDRKSADDMIAIGLDYIKVPSCRASDFALIDYIRKQYRGPLHIPLGMTDRAERRAIERRYAGAMFYISTSDYSGDGKQYIEPGYPASLHSPSVLPAMAAVATGSPWLECHITVDRFAKGGDHKVSLLPHEYWQVKQARDGGKVQIGRPKHIPYAEMPARKKLWGKSN